MSEIETLQAEYERLNRSLDIYRPRQGWIGARQSRIPHLSANDIERINKINSRLTAIEEEIRLLS